MTRFGVPSILLFFAFLITPSSFAKDSLDPLPSWRSGAVKTSILEFVKKVTNPKGADFVPLADRVATFDNDGTLWQEKPLVQGVFMLERLKVLVANDPALMENETVKRATLEGLGFLEHVHGKELVELLNLTQTNLSQATFDSEGKKFLESARHPRWNKRYIDLTYKPMTELLGLLRKNGFKVYIVSGAGVDFMRLIPNTVYGLSPNEFIGSSFVKEMRASGGHSDFWILPQIRSANDKAEKVINIDLHVGKRPVFAAGNVGGGGDVGMLTYSKERQGASLQLLVNHDDATREFSYAETNDISLAAAKKFGFLVISMKDDWRNIFGEDRPPAVREHRKVPAAN